MKVKFLYDMYNHPNFGFYLFSIITILAILFVIVLCLALKDAKKLANLKDEEDKLNKDLENDKPNDEVEFAFKEDEENHKLDFETDNHFDDYDDNYYDNTYDDEEFKTSIMASINEDDYKNESFDELDAPINLEEVNDLENDKVDFMDDTFDFKEEEENKDEWLTYEKPKEVSNQFSSVNISEEPVKEEKVVKEDIQEFMPRIKNIPSPKPIDPIKTMDEVKPMPSLNDIEPESYDI